MRRRSSGALPRGAIALALLLAIGCVSRPPRIGKTFEFFAPPQSEDPFYDKIEEWQRRESEESEGRALELPVPASTEVKASRFGLLRLKFDAFLNRHKRALAREFTAWSQRQARQHYAPDPRTTLAGDHWPTLAELFENNGDDCDGLDLIAYALLREAGFRDDEIYRLIVRRERDGANHMVTLWFEDREDPWVIDATGAMTMEMRKFSDLPSGWLPRMMFNETEMYHVVERRPPPYALIRD